MISSYNSFFRCRKILRMGNIDSLTLNSRGSSRKDGWIGLRNY
jgi:hypothetical protein